MYLINRKHHWAISGISLSFVFGLSVPITLQAGDSEPLESQAVQTIIEPEMVDIRGGCFQMGSPASEEGRKEEDHKEEEDPRDFERQHRVCVEDFSLGKYELTVAEFRRFVDATGYRTDAETGKGCYFFNPYEYTWTQHGWANWKKPNEGKTSRDRDPVTCMSWNDSMAYIDWLNQETRGNYRLPTEAEWEYAARAGTTTRFFWGDEEAPICTYANGADQSLQEHFPDRKQSQPNNGCRDGAAFTAPVGSFQPNGFGLFDMSGNIAEWTCCLYKDNYDGNETRCVPREIKGKRAVRGGAWLDIPRYLRSAVRFQFEYGKPGSDDPGMDVSSNFLGFRLARDL
uniref:Formylglycine-generating enzyme, required for sulfatase activity, contains SUMF1/FGE domain n=1 Tax=Candidatus Kentrum sp. LPFa TaxID=2126335 RepID=A0A450W461_9GAMM|nr:MAG: Formylglycine-generating enzyme, required for sulfatase activity, contains SUMF1/FGE domain [Candidatus Kentron sp. LPFa]